MLPKFSVVTPTFNSEVFLAETIESVISQKGDFSIEYILMDGGSTDQTLEIINSYITKLKKNKIAINCKSIDISVFSAKDQGMYDAINKGFEKASGKYYAWINSDDIYLPSAFQTALAAFQKYPEVEWLKGITSYINNRSIIYKAGHCLIYTKSWISLGVYGGASHFIQQDSVFWTATLWGKVQKIDTSYKVAGDFYLWCQFAKHSSLVSINALFSCFRKVEGQLSSDLMLYKAEMDSICSINKLTKLKVKLFNYTEKYFPNCLSCVFHRLLFGQLSFNAIKVTSNGDLRKTAGSYCKVKALLDSEYLD